MRNPVFILAQTTPGTNSPPAGTDTAAEGSSAIAGVFDFGALGLLLEGGVFMWPILLMALIGLAVIIERWRSLKMQDVDVGELKQAVLNDLTENRVGKVAPDAALAIGYTYEEQSKKKDAIKWFQRTCKLYPRTRNASKAHAHLKKNTASASPSVAQGKNDPARGVLTFVGLIGNPRLGCNPRPPR